MRNQADTPQLYFDKILFWVNNIYMEMSTNTTRVSFFRHSFYNAASKEMDCLMPEKKQSCIKQKA